MTLSLRPEVGTWRPRTSQSFLAVPLGVALWSWCVFACGVAIGTLFSFGGLVFAALLGAATFWMAGSALGPLIILRQDRARMIKYRLAGLVLSLGRIDAVAHPCRGGHSQVGLLNPEPAQPRLRPPRSNSPNVLDRRRKGLSAFFIADERANRAMRLFEGM